MINLHDVVEYDGRLYTVLAIHLRSGQLSLVPTDGPRSMIHVYANEVTKQ